MKDMEMLQEMQRRISEKQKEIREKRKMKDIQKNKSFRFLSDKQKFILELLENYDEDYTVKLLNEYIKKNEEERGKYFPYKARTYIRTRDLQNFLSFLLSQQTQTQAERKN